MNKEINYSSYNLEEEGNEHSLENDEMMCELKYKNSIEDEWILIDSKFKY